MSIYVDKENAQVSFQNRPTSLKTGINNPGTRVIQGKSIASDTVKSSTFRKPLGSVNRSRDPKKRSEEEKGDLKGDLKESLKSLKTKAAADGTGVKLAAELKKVGLSARPVDNSGKENASKKLQEPKKSDNIANGPMKPLSLGPSFPEVIVPAQANLAEAHHDVMEGPASPVERRFFPLPSDDEDEFENIWPASERPTAFINNVLRWGFIPGRRVDLDSSSSGSSPISVGERGLIADEMSFTDDEDDKVSDKLFVPVGDFPPLPELPSLSELLEDFDVEYFSNLA